MSRNYANHRYHRSGSTIDVYDATGGQDITATTVTLNLDTERANSDDGTFTLSGDVVTINRTGRFAFLISATVDNRGKNEIEGWLERNSVEVTGTKLNITGVT